MIKLEINLLTAHEAFCKLLSLEPEDTFTAMGSNLMIIRIAELAQCMHPHYLKYQYQIIPLIQEWFDGLPIVKEGDLRKKAELDGKCYAITQSHAMSNWYGHFSKKREGSMISIQRIKCI